MELEKAIKQLEIMLNCRKKQKEEFPECQNCNEDIKAIETVLQTLKNSIPKKKIEDKIKELKNKIKQNENELRKKPEPVDSGFSSFDEYFKWHSKVIHENELLKEEIKDIQQLLEDK